ncbi:tetratricopeptide repeat protein [Planktothrix sp.]
MKNLLNNFKASLKHNHQKILILILAFLAGVELLGLVYAFNIIRLNQKEKLYLEQFKTDLEKSQDSLEQSQSWDYYTLSSYLSKDPLYYNETKVIESLGKYLILDPNLKIANKALFDKIYNHILPNHKFGDNKGYQKDENSEILDSQKFHDYRNSCLSSIINPETVKSFSNLQLDSDTAYIKRGKIRFYLEDYPGAIRDFEKAKNLNPNNKDPLNQAIALAYFELGNPKYFRNGYVKYSLLDQIEHPGMLFNRLKEYSSSAISFNPNLANAYYLRGYLRSHKINYLFSTGSERMNIKEAISNEIKKGIFNDEEMLEMIDDFTNAIRNDPFFYKKYPSNEINFCPSFSDEYPSQIKSLTEKIKTNLNDSFLYYQRALIYLDSKNYQKSIEDLNKVIQLNSSNNSLKALAYYGLWLAHYKQKNYQKALENINQVIKIYPDFADFYAIRGLTYYDFSKLSKNTKDLEKVIEDSNHAIKLHEELLKKLNPKEDSRFLDDQPSANAYFIRGLAYYDLGNQEQALLDYRKSLGLWPSLVTGDEGGGVTEMPLPPGFPP